MRWDRLDFAVLDLVHAVVALEALADHRHGAGIQVEVTPAQADQLAAPRPGAGREVQQRIQPLGAGIGAGGEVRPLPEPAAERRSEELPDGQVRFWPSSAPVEEGVRYRMSTYTHCALDYLFGFDGSFWEVAAGPPEPRGDVLGDPENDGVVTLIDHDTAVYESSHGGAFRLTRVDGPRDIHLCE